jgi:hypothetical protein
MQYGLVVELVDTPDSKSGVRKDVWVRVPPRLQHADMGELVDPPDLESGAEISVSVRARLSVQTYGVINLRLKGSKPSFSHSVEGTLALDSKERVGAGG